MNSFLVGRVLLEYLSSFLDHNLSDGTRKDHGKANVLHPVGSQGIRLAPRDLIDVDQGVDGVQETIVGGDKCGHAGVKGGLVDKQSPVDLCADRLYQQADEAAMADADLTWRKAVIPDMASSMFPGLSTIPGPKKSAFRPTRLTKGKVMILLNPTRCKS